MGKIPKDQVETHGLDDILSENQNISTDRVIKIDNESDLIIDTGNSYYYYDGTGDYYRHSTLKMIGTYYGGYSFKTSFGDNFLALSLDTWSDYESMSGTPASRLYHTVDGRFGISHSSKNSFRVNGSEVSLGRPLRLHSLTVATLPTPYSHRRGYLVFVLDESGGPTLAYCDGTNWRRIYDNAIVS